MKIITKKHLDYLKMQYPIGTIVKLVLMEDSFAPTKGTIVKLVLMEDSFAPTKGTLGKVFHIDDTGIIHVKWDNGTTLGVVYGIDKERKIVNG